ncbi:SMI1/KNR4 family protein [Streptomyces sp. MUM 178J]|uniref:SMI1/KNR4 family protein n=1 Tax=Streptomyces sp. MUM 178J TaxID=2791991 RepID=UPI001F04471C|nr:SMI1/KNR4 family protein [Streptomyces sp. MUM 178J]WRQ81962.1 SMI1/KNR4 family protein [Streptomyces sp. MUM 178J]
MTETEHLLNRAAAAARTSDWQHEDPLPPLADPSAVADAEAALGFALPSALTALHMRIADGGFGPGYGLLPLESIAARYASQREAALKEPDWPWPEGVVPVVDWGCGMLACVDCRSQEAVVLLFEPNAGEADHAWYVDAPSFAEWLTAWLDGTAWHSEEGGETEQDADAESDDGLKPWEEFRSRI